MISTLADAKAGQTVKVTKIFGQGALRRRIMDMGITKGVRITVRKLAPLGDPMQLTLRGYELTLRHENASLIQTEICYQ